MAIDQEPSHFAVVRIRFEYVLKPFDRFVGTFEPREFLNKAVKRIYVRGVYRQRFVQCIDRSRVITGTAEPVGRLAIGFCSLVKLIVFEESFGKCYENLRIVRVEQPDLFPDGKCLVSVALFEVVFGQRRVMRLGFGNGAL